MISKHARRIGKPIERLVQRHGTVALALGDGEQPGLRAGAGMGVDARRSVTTKLSARSVSSPTS